jgi:hypothetical protein
MNLFAGPQECQAGWSIRVTVLESLLVSDRSRIRRVEHFSDNEFVVVHLISELSWQVQEPERLIAGWGCRESGVVVLFTLPVSTATSLVANLLILNP